MFAFSGLTGSALVFYKGIDELLNPALLTVEPGGEYARLTEITAAAQKAVPVSAKPARLYFPPHLRAPFKIRFTLPKEDQTVLLDVMVNPFTAEVLGQRRWGGYLMSCLYKMHFTLLSGKRGETIVGVIGLLLICSVVSGVVLWWRQPGKFLQAFTFRHRSSPVRQIYDLHKTVGAYACIVLVVAAFSGISMIFPQYMKSALSMILPVEQLPPSGISKIETGGGQKINIHEVASIARDFFPRAKLQRIYFPSSTEAAFRIIMRQPGEIRQTSGSTQLWISAYNGEIRKTQEPQTMSSRDTLLSWMFPIHNGEALGMPGRVLMFLAGFAPIHLYVTGLIVWQRKRKARLRADFPGDPDTRYRKRSPTT